MDRLEMLEFEGEMSVKIHKTFEFSTSQFIHKPLVRFSKFSARTSRSFRFRIQISLKIILRTSQVFDNSLILCSKPVITSEGFMINIMSLDILHDKKTGYCHQINFSIFKMNQVVEYRGLSNRPASTGVFVCSVNHYSAEFPHSWDNGCKKAKKFESSEQRSKRV